MYTVHKIIRLINADKLNEAISLMKHQPSHASAKIYIDEFIETLMGIKSLINSGEFDLARNKIVEKNYYSNTKIIAKYDQSALNYIQKFQNIQKLNLHVAIDELNTIMKRSDPLYKLLSGIIKSLVTEDYFTNSKTIDDHIKTNRLRLFYYDKITPEMDNYDNVIIANTMDIKNKQFFVNYLLAMASFYNNRKLYEAAKYYLDKYYKVYNDYNNVDILYKLGSVYLKMSENSNNSDSENNEYAKTGNKYLNECIYLCDEILKTSKYHSKLIIRAKAYKKLKYFIPHLLINDSYIAFDKDDQSNQLERFINELNTNKDATTNQTYNTTSINVTNITDKNILLDLFSKLNGELKMFFPKLEDIKLSYNQLSFIDLTMLNTMGIGSLYIIEQPGNSSINGLKTFLINVIKTTKLKEIHISTKLLNEISDIEFKEIHKYIKIHKNLVYFGEDINDLSTHLNGHVETHLHFINETCHANEHPKCYGIEEPWFDFLESENNTDSDQMSDDGDGDGPTNTDTSIEPEIEPRPLFSPEEFDNLINSTSPMKPNTTVDTNKIVDPHTFFDRDYNEDNQLPNNIQENQPDVELENDWDVNTDLSHFDNELVMKRLNMEDDDSQSTDDGSQSTDNFNLDDIGWDNRSIGNSQDSSAMADAFMNPNLDNYNL